MPRIIGLGHPSRTLEGNSRKRSESASGVFPESFRNFCASVAIPAAIYRRAQGPGPESAPRSAF